MAKPKTGKAGTPTGSSRSQLFSRSISRSELSRLLTQTSLEQLLDLVSARHAVHFETVRIGSDVLECLQLTDMQAYIEQRLNPPLSEVATGAQPATDIDTLPLWAKIWPASLPLAMYMRRLAPEPGERVLEIGAGLGLAGLFAAKRGFSVVLSDIVPEAMLFARINALRNGLGDLAAVQSVNFMEDDHPERYHRIIASEVVYREQCFEPLLSFFRTHLEPVPTAEILLSASAGRRSIKFFVAAKDFFQISRSCVSPPASLAEHAGQPGSEARQDTYLYRLRPR